MELGVQANDGRPVPDHIVTARQIFDYCGGDNNGVLRVSVLMEKFAPFVNTNKVDFHQLESLLDPEECNPEINIQNLAEALNKYSETHMAKADLDESFNLQNGQVPQDSDSGISTDGFQLLEELQSELREKAHLAHMLRTQLEFADRHHEEALAALTSERDSLRHHLHMVREENVSVSELRRECEAASERASGGERALAAARLDLDAGARREHALRETVAALDAQKATLQELLSKSKEECHRINEMYASRQAALLERNEALRAEHAMLAAKLADHEELLHQLMNEKMVLETELKEAVNKCNQRQTRAASVEVSYTEDQMLSVLDTMHQDHFAQDNKILNEESFLNELRNEHIGRSTNVSLFEEIRCSFNASRCADAFKDMTTQTDTTTLTVNVQTDLETSVLADEGECKKCKESKSYTMNLENDLKLAENTIMGLQMEMTKYEGSLKLFEGFLNEGSNRIDVFEGIVSEFEVKISALEKISSEQKTLINSLACETKSAESQTNCEYVSVATQEERPCLDCVTRNAAPQGTLKRYFWETGRWAMQALGAACLLAALLVLYALMRTHSRYRCAREQVPWRWLDAQDLMDLFLRIEYVAEVPM